VKLIILYSVSGCPLCARYRALFDEHGVAFEERNTTENPAFREELVGLGIMATPTVLIGDDAVPGFRPNTVTELIAA
jgi:glutaredoxin